MSDQSTMHSDVELLLPWYVNGTLDDTERQMVEGHLGICADCRNSVELLGQMKSAVHGRSPVPIVPKPRIDEMLEHVEAGAAPATSPGRNYAWMIAASVAAVAIALFVMYAGPGERPDEPALFETATSSDAGMLMEYVLEMRFEPETSATDQNTLLGNIGAREVLFDEARGTHRVIIDLPARSVQELNDFTSALQENPAIQSAEIVALQLPVRPEQ